MTKTNKTDAKAAFVAKKAEIDELLALLTTASACNFDAVDTQAAHVDWSDVGSLSFIAAKLKEITEFLGHK